MTRKYTARTFTTLTGLKGLSSEQVDEHLELYKGYVDRTNALTKEIDEVAANTEAAPLGKDPKYAELTRRLGFEYDGMVLHELYFEALAGNAGGKPADGSLLLQAIKTSFGSFDRWLEDFKGIAAMPGVGWVITYENPKNGWLSNHWITLHQEGHPAGFTPVIVMDVWEHAFMRDYRANERASYVDAFFKNLAWNVCERRLRVAPPAFQKRRASDGPQQRS